MQQRFEVVEYMDAGCFQVERGPGYTLGLALHDATDGRMCEGCPKFDGGKCQAYKTLTHNAAQQKRATLAQTETVREEAARLNISISEVRRRRRRRGPVTDAEGPLP